MNRLNYRPAEFLCGLIVLLLASTALGQNLPGQVVTYADFSYVHHVASSMSHVYFATTEGITRYSKIDQRWELPLTSMIGDENSEVRRVWVDTFDEELYITTDFNQYEYDLLFESWTMVFEIPDIRNDSRHVRIPPGIIPPFGYNFTSEGSLIDRMGRSYPVTDVVDDGAGNLWLGMWGYGGGRADVSSKQIDLLPFGLLQNHVNAIYDDGELLWVSGLTGQGYRTGLTAFDPEQSEFFYVESGLESDFPAEDVLSLAGDDRAIYIGTAWGLFVYDRQLERITDRINHKNGLISDVVLALQVVGDSVFVGTDEGLTLLDMAKDSVGYINPGEFLNLPVYDFALADSVLWIAAGSGGYRLHLGTGKLQQFLDPDHVIFKAAYNVEVFGESVWFASEYGLAHLDTRTGATEPYLDRAYVHRKRALAVSDRIAATSSDNGLTLFFFDEGKPLSREFTTDDGFPSGNVNCLLMDGDYIWVGTDRGLSHFYWNNPDRID
jgi:ligand-binding sensor domain-containing protein